MPLSNFGFYTLVCNISCLRPQSQLVATRRIPLTTWLIAVLLMCRNSDNRFLFLSRRIVYHLPVTSSTASVSGLTRQNERTHYTYHRRLLFEFLGAQLSFGDLEGLNEFAYDLSKLRG